MKYITLAVALLSTAAITACVSQEQADAKMIEGCKAAITAMIEPTTVHEFKTASGESEKTMGSVYRRIKLTYVEEGDFAESIYEGSCLFSEQWGLMKSSHAALLEQVAYKDEIVGKKDGEIHGDMNDFLKLTEKVDTAMGQQ